MTLDEAILRLYGQLDPEAKRELLDYGYWLLAEQDGTLPPVRVCAETYDPD